MKNEIINIDHNQQLHQIIGNGNYAGIKRDIIIDSEKFETIYKEYWESLYAIGYKKIKSKTDVEDIIQEIFIALWKRKTIKINSSLKIYLYTAMKYKIIDYFRKSKFHLVGLEHLNGKDVSLMKTEQLILLNELYDKLKIGVDRLPKKCKLIFKMSREEGLSSAEIANKLKLSKRTVESQLYKSLKNLKRYFKD